MIPDGDNYITMPQIPAAVGEYLKPDYPMTCPVCVKHQRVRPSILMRMNINRGSGCCLRCKTLLLLAISEDGESITGVVYPDSPTAEEFQEMMEKQ